ncbi:2653_t:CDS:1, partial [Acaulospora colombiana]
MPDLAPQPAPFIPRYLLNSPLTKHNKYCPEKEIKLPTKWNKDDKSDCI